MPKSNIDKADKKASTFDFVKKNSKIVWLTIAALVLVWGSFAVYFGITYFQNRDFAAEFEGDKITKVEVNENSAFCEGFARFNSDQELNDNCQDSALEDIVLKRALLAEAESHNIKVSSQELEEKLKDLVAPYGGEENYFSAVSSAYGWDRAYVIDNLKRDMLQEKLAKYLLDERSVTGIFVRYDFDGDVEATTQEKNDKLAKTKLEKDFYNLLKSGVDQDKLEEKVASLRNDAEAWKTEATIGVMKFTDINSQIAVDKFEGPEDWQAIKELVNVGDVTPVVKSTGGYYVAYRLDARNTGSYATWDDYSQALIEKTKKYTFLPRVNIAMGEWPKFSFVTPAYAARINCSANHFSSLYGTLVEGGNTSLKISGASISGKHGSIGEYPKCKDPERATDSTSSNGNGFFDLGKVKNKSYQALSCWVRWDVTVSASHYESISYNERSVYANGVQTMLDHKLSRSNETYSGDYKKENTDGDGKLYLKLITHNLTVNKSGAGTGTVKSSPSGINCGGDCSQVFRDGQLVKLTATAGTNSTFKSWAGCDSVTGTVCSVTMNKARSATVTFDYSEPANPDPEITLNTPSDGQRYDLTAAQASSGGIDIALSATVKERDNENVKMNILLKKCASDSDCSEGDWTYKYVDSDFHTSPWTPTGVMTGLINPGEGTHEKYIWYAEGFDTTTASEGRPVYSEYRTFTVYGRPATPKVSCSVLPDTGTVPFSVKVNYSVTYPGVTVDNSKIQISMGDGTTFTGTQRPPMTDFRYSYNKAGDTGKYTINITYPGASEVCNWEVKANDPGESGGGEVTP